MDATQISEEVKKYNQTGVMSVRSNVLCGLLPLWGLTPLSFLDLESEEERVGKSFKVCTYVIPVTISFFMFHLLIYLLHLH